MLPNEIQKGIALHRFIDTFTDIHPFTKKGINIFKNDYRLYGRVFMDVIYDYFLANDKNIFPKNDLEKFSKSVYNIIEKNFEVIPELHLSFFKNMIQYDFLCNYRSTMGVEKSFMAIARRAKYFHDSSVAFSLFNNHLDELENCYQNFFPDVLMVAKSKFDELLLKKI